MAKTKVEISEQVKGKRHEIGGTGAGEEGTLIVRGGGTSSASVSFEGEVSVVDGVTELLKVSPATSGATPTDAEIALGCDVDMNGNDLDNVGDINANSVSGDGSGLTGISSKLPFTEITDTSVQMESNNGYIMSNASAIDATLPETPEVGDVIRIIGRGDSGTGGWNILVNENDEIKVGNLITLKGTGIIQALNYTDCIDLVCVSVEEGSVVWATSSMMGVLDVEVDDGEGSVVAIPQSAIDIPLYKQGDVVTDGDLNTAVIDWNLSRDVEFNVDDDYEVTFVDPVQETGKMTLILKNAGSYTLTWATTIYWVGKAEPEWTTGTDIVSIYYVSGAYYAAAGLDFGEAV